MTGSVSCMTSEKGIWPESQSLLSRLPEPWQVPSAGAEGGEGWADEGTLVGTYRPRPWVG